MRPDGRLAWLDFARGVSAMIVCSGHLRLAMMADHSELASSSAVTKLVYGVTGLGHQAVMVFFVLSGYFVGGSVLGQGASFRWSRYATARLVRLWIVLLPALVWTLAVDRTMAVWQPEVLTGAYLELWQTGPPPGVYSISFLTFLGNVFFLQTMLTPEFGSNGPLWSLAYEACYYVIFPLAMFAIGRCGQGSRFARAIAMALAVAMVVAIGPQKRIGFVVWLMGVLVAQWGARKPPVHARWIVLIGCVALALSLQYSKATDWHVHHELLVHPDLVVGAAFAIITYGLLGAREPAFANGLFTRASVAISEMSYSLYVVHFPLVLLIGATFYVDSPQLQPSPRAYAELLGWFLLMITVGFCFWWLFERRTAQVRAYVERRLQGGGRSASFTSAASS